jgi:hypothetical protein
MAEFPCLVINRGKFYFCQTMKYLLLTNARIFEGISYTFIPKGNCEKGERRGKGRESKSKLGKT